jgi:hypothetical protein
MRPRHAAALSWLLIAGCMQSVSRGAWLLLVPPITMDGIVDNMQPLSEWRQAWNFGTQTDCIAFLQRQQFMIHRAFGPLTSGSAQNADQIQAVPLLSNSSIRRLRPHARGGLPQIELHCMVYGISGGLSGSQRVKLRRVCLLRKEDNGTADALKAHAVRVSMRGPEFWRPGRCAQSLGPDLTLRNRSTYQKVCSFVVNRS